jgi:hypothetical protein
MREVTLSTGYVVQLDEAAMDDMELLDLLTDFDSAEGPEKLVYISKLSKRLLGIEGRKALYDQIRDESGRVPVERFSEVFMEILKGMGDDKKKSSPSPE